MILITGLTGTSGTAFYDLLCRNGFKEKIRAVVRPTTDLSIFHNTPLDLETVVGDVTDVDFMTEAMKGCDTVFHIAAKVFNKDVAFAIAKAPSVKNAVFISSTIVYSEFYPTSTLHMDEPIIRDTLKECNVRCVFLRPTMIFGTTKDQNISRFIGWLLRFRLFPVVKHGEATIQPVCRLDVAEAYYSVLMNIDHMKSDDYIVSGERSMTLLEMLQIIARLADRKVRFFNVPFGLAKFIVNAAYVFSFKRINYKEQLDRLAEDRAYPHDKISEELGYAPKSFEERVLPLIEEIKSNK